MRRRVTLLAVIGALWVGAVSARLYQLQVLRYDHYQEKARRQQQRVVELDPPRGTIYDAQGRELAVSLEVESAWADPSNIEDPQATAAALAQLLGLDAKALAKRLSNGKNQFVWVARKLDPPVAEKVKRLGLRGLHFLPESKRYYPMGELAAQVLGYVGLDNKGLAGLELAYDRQVAGRPGRRTLLRDARRGTVVAPGLAYAEAQPGADLHLTLDATIQHIVERELAAAVEQNRAKSGNAVLLDPQTGAVLAMASYPAFDPNDYGHYPPARWRNRVIADAFEPGSTFKVVTAAAALEAGLVRPDEEFNCEHGAIVLAGVRIRDHKPFDRLTFAQVLAKSSNIGMIKTALRLGDRRLFNTIRDMGFGRPTGIDLPGESQGIVAPLSAWRPLTKCYASFGQGISITPLQLAAAVGAVANGGRLLTPYVVAGVDRGGPGEPHAGAVAARPISEATARQLRVLLEGVVEEGTGKRAGVPGYRVAGKTGTAQKPGVGGYTGNGYIPSFVGFAPADRPVLVGVVAIDDPPGEHHGGLVAAPVFGAIARQVLLYRGVRPERQPLPVWPGQRPMMLASLAPQAPAGAAPAAGAQDPADLDDGDVVPQGEAVLDGALPGGTITIGGPHGATVPVPAPRGAGRVPPAAGGAETTVPGGAVHAPR